MNNILINIGYKLVYGFSFGLGMSFSFRILPLELNKNVEYYVIGTRSYKTSIFPAEYELAKRKKII